ncbi:MAG: DUF4311 domain-containing protein [Anaerorhabdus sp.]
MIDLILKSAVVGALAGAGTAAGAARMYHAPNIQGMGAFRTLGEMNACNGDAISHMSYGLGFLFSSAGSVVGTGSLSSDVLHRIVPQWSAGLAIGVKKDKEAFKNPLFMMIAGAIVGALVVVFLNTLANIIPDTMSVIANNVVAPAAGLILFPVMPVAFWLAASGAGKTHTMYATIFGVFAQYIMGNATPGLVLGILIGQSVVDDGLKSKKSILMLAFVIIMFVLIAFFREKLPWQL